MGNEHVVELYRELEDGNEITLEVTVHYSPEEKRTWNHPGYDAEVEVEGAINAETGEAVELTEDEVERARENGFDAARDAAEYMADNEHLRKERIEDRLCGFTD